MKMIELSVALRKEGLTDRTAAVLELARGGVASGEVATAVGVSAACATKLLDSLEKAEFAIRTREEKDRRKVVLKSTPLGSRRLRRALESAGWAETSGPDGEGGSK